jgi:hypothetical protein
MSDSGFCVFAVYRLRACVGVVAPNYINIPLQFSHRGYTGGVG